MERNPRPFKAYRSFFLLTLLFFPWLIFPACTVATPEEHGHAHPDDLAVTQQALIDCSESKDTGYTQGKAFTITVVHVDGKPVEKATANAYYVMQQAAAKSGVAIRIVSGFRTMSQQQYLYNCYKNCNCNNCNLAARPGYSNHQSGHALDLNTSSSGVLTWLNNNGSKYGFKRTVSSEPWHWEWWGGGPGGGPCGTCKTTCDGNVIVNEKCQRTDCAASASKCVNDSLGIRCVSNSCPNQGSKKLCVDKKTLGTCKDGKLTKGDCSAFGSSCVDDSLGARCVFGACPAQGKKDVCLSDRELGNCDNGQLSKKDCGASDAYCSTAGVTNARCVSVFCVEDPQDVPEAHDVCLADGSIGRCDDNGAVKSDPCAEGKTCHSSPNVRCIGKAAPKGYLDQASCDEISGWSQDPDEPDVSIDVHVYFKGPAGDAEARGIAVRADVHRDDLCNAIGSCKHGYTLAPPLSLFNGQEHPVHAYGIDSEGGNNSISPTAPKHSSVILLLLRASNESSLPRHLQHLEILDFWDMLPIKEEQFSQLPDGTDLPLKPQLVQTETDPSVTWLIDGGYRRKIPSDKAFQLWRFETSEIQKWTQSQLERYQEGTDLRERPMLAEDENGQTYLFDDAQAPLILEPPPQDGQTQNESSVIELSTNHDASAQDEILSLQSPPASGCACNASSSSPSEAIFFFAFCFWFAMVHQIEPNQATLGKTRPMKQYIGHIALVVRDYDEAIAFYVETLGFQLIEDTYIKEQDKRWVLVAPPGATETQLLLARADGEQQTPFVGNQAGGRVFLFLHTDDFWRDYKRYQEKGVHFVRPPKEEPYGVVAVFQDHYGNLWDLIQRTPPA